MKIREIQRVASYGLMSVIASIAACSQGYHSKPIEFAYRDRLGDQSISAEAILCEAGRIYCDANTYEADGEIHKKSPEREERIRIRCVFGPNGEFRLACGDKASIFDGDYLGGHLSGQYMIAYDIKKMASGVKTMGRPDMKLCRPERLGDGAMLIGCAAYMGDEAGLECLGRALGCEWLGQYLREEKCTVTCEGNEHSQGVPCFKILMQAPEAQPYIRLWIDKQLGVVRRYDRYMGQTVISVFYDVIRINHPLKTDEFKLPDEAIQRFKEKQRKVAK